jgi:hypothetical protein
MIRAWIIAIVYLCGAFVMERGVLSQAMAVMPHETGGYLDWRLLALGGMLIGLMTASELAGLAMAAGAALLAGFSQSPGFLGASLVSYGVTAAMAGKLGRHFRFQSVGFSAFWFFFLLAAERLIWTAVRLFFFRSGPLGLGWRNFCALAITAFLGGIVVAIMMPQLQRAMFRVEMKQYLSR